MKPLKKLRKKIEVALVRLGLVVLPRLRRNTILKLSRLGGWCAYRWAGNLRRIGLANLDLAYKDDLTPKEKQAILRQSLQTFALASLDIFWFARNTEARVRQYVSFDPSFGDLLREQAHICVTAHMGNWEVLGHAMAVQGYPMVSVAAPLANPGIEDLFRDLREHAGQHIVARKGALKQLLRTLRGKGKIGLLLDQNTKPSEGGLFVDFFGVPASVSQAAALLTDKTGAAVYMGFCLPRPDGHYLVQAPAGQLDPGLAGQDITVGITRSIEQTIRAHPGMWLWSYKRWKWIPEGHHAADFPYYARPLRPADR